MATALELCNMTVILSGSLYMECVALLYQSYTNKQNTSLGKGQNFKRLLVDFFSDVTVVFTWPGGSTHKPYCS